MTANLTCPICNAQSFEPFLNVKDFTVSHETFQLLKCSSCGFVITDPIPKDLGRYYQSTQYISHSNKSSSITDVLYKLARTATLRWKVNLINHHSVGPFQTLLDYGCGTGAFLAHAKKSGWTIAGVEPADQPRATATIHTKTSIVSNIQQLPADKFRAITLWHVLEHVEDLHTVLAALSSRLEDRGTIFIAVPNHNSYDARKYKEYWAAYDTPRHLWHFSQQHIRTLMKQHGLTVHTIVPMKLDALYVSILSETYQSDKTPAGMFTLLRGIINGFKSNIAALRNQEYSSLIYIARK